MGFKIFFKIFKIVISILKIFKKRKTYRAKITVVINIDIN